MPQLTNNLPLQYVGHLFLITKLVSYCMHINLPNIYAIYDKIFSSVALTSRNTQRSLEETIFSLVKPFKCHLNGLGKIIENFSHFKWNTNWFSPMKRVSAKEVQTTVSCGILLQSFRASLATVGRWKITRFLSLCQFNSWNNHLSK